jgi:hypothetical protein
VNVGGAGAGKMNVGTVDPPYTIGGQRYATYMASMVGVKEEVTGVANTTENVPGVGYRSVIDFGRLTQGTDLWLFSKTTDLRTNINNLVVILNPSGNTRAWYDLDATNYRLAIYTSQPSRVSYRFTAPRFDAAQWQNTRTNTIEGFNINGLAAIDPSTIPLITPNANIIAGLGITTTTTPATGLLFDLKNSAGAFIYDVGQFSQAAIANLKAGWLQVDTITPLTSSGITVKLDGAQKLTITDTAGTPKTSFDVLGNATLSGQLQSNSLVVNQNATFNGDISQTNGINGLADQGSLVSNAGFELHTGTTSAPDAWNCTNVLGSTGSCTYNTTTFNQGNASMAVTKTNALNSLQFASTCIPVTAGVRYNIALRARANTAFTTAQFEYGIWEFSSQTNCESWTNETPTMTTSTLSTTWVQKTASPTVGSGTYWVRAGGTIQSIAGTAYIDSFRMTQQALTSAIDIAENYYVSSPLVPGIVAQIHKTIAHRHRVYQSCTCPWRRYC